MYSAHPGIVERHLENERRLVAALPKADREQLAGLLRRLLHDHESAPRRR